MSLNIDTDALRSLAYSLGKIGAPLAEQGLSLGLSTLGGPFGGLVAQGLNLVYPAINNALGLAPDTPPDQVQQFVESNPDVAAQKLQTLQEDHNFQLGMAKIQTDASSSNVAQQVALNTVQATAPNQDWLSRNWRPMVGWGFGGTVFAKLGFLPLFVWLMLCFGVHLPNAPVADIQEVAILTGMLGLVSISRTYEKQNANSTVKAIVRK